MFIKNLLKKYFMYPKLYHGPNLAILQTKTTANVLLNLKFETILVFEKALQRNRVVRKHSKRCKCNLPSSNSLIELLQKKKMLIFIIKVPRAPILID